QSQLGSPSKGAGAFSERSQAIPLSRQSSPRNGDCRRPGEKLRRRRAALPARARTGSERFRHPGRSWLLVSAAEPAGRERTVFAEGGSGESVQSESSQASRRCLCSPGKNQAGGRDLRQSPPSGRGSQAARGKHPVLSVIE